MFCPPQLIEDLRKQLEHLQLYKLEAEARRGRSPSAGLQEYQSRTREAELEQEVRRLKQVRSPCRVPLGAQILQGSFRRTQILQGSFKRTQILQGSFRKHF